MTKLEINKPKFGELTQIASDLYWAHFELPFRLNHVNLFLMDTPKGFLILDAGLKSDHSEEHWETLIKGPLKSKKFAGFSDKSSSDRITDRILKLLDGGNGRI